MKLRTQMLRAVAIAGLLALAPFAGRAGAAVIMTEDFETDGDGSRYIQSHSVTSAGSDGYYDEAEDGTTINNGDGENIERFSGVNGSYYFLHDFGGVVKDNTITLTFDDVDVSLYEDLELDILLGGGDKMDNNEEERLRILVREDNIGDDSSAYTVIDTFSYTGTNGNGDKVSNGSVTLDYTLQNVNYDLSSFDSASMIDIQIETIGTSGNNHKELFAFDNVRLSGIPEPATMGLLALGGLAMLKRRRRA